MKNSLWLKSAVSVLFVAAMFFTRGGLAGEGGSNLLFAPCVEVLSFEVVADSKANAVWRTAASFLGIRSRGSGASIGLRLRSGFNRRCIPWKKLA